MYRVQLKKGEEKRIVDGHSWVYANEAAKIENIGDAKNGSLAEVFSHDSKYIGKGYINHLSKILVRIFIRDDAEDTKEYYLDAIRRANEARMRLGFSGSYRVVFSESDGLPALIVDKYENVLVMQCLSLGIDKRKKMIAECLEDIFAPKGIYERSDAAVRKKEGLEESTGVLYGEVPDLVEITENGLRILVDVRGGQKTGYYLDQKENRYAVRRYSKGEVLDCFSNIGGFSLNAALSADSVLSCDISDSALCLAEKNAALNGLNNIKTLRCDVFDELRVFRKEKRTFDTVILDPPAFCKSQSEVAGAYRGYLDINLNAMKLVNRGGYLITCSCSHYMTPALFEKMIRDAAKASGRTVRIVETRTQAADHPINVAMEETGYLKFYALNVI
ncbi:MAG: class I SAM-dependent rRNA methyltransferase [Clostridia bacterium]|nr:class I SAM-dependent rRNA methyltransferase [Clostridia bacterium]